MLRVGEQIRRRRRRRGLSQAELGRRTGLQVSYLSKVETGVIRPGLVNVERIARSLSASVAELVAPLRRRP